MSEAVADTHAFYVDSHPLRLSEESRVTERVAEVSALRAVIEQAKGMLGAVYGLDDASAFAVLRWRSQVTNTKLRAFADQLVVDFKAVAGDKLPSRSTYDSLLLSVHERVARA